MYLIPCHPHAALPLTVVSASIPLAPPTHHHHFWAGSNLYPAFASLSSFLWTEVFLLHPNQDTRTHTHIMQLSKNVCIAQSVHAWMREKMLRVANGVFLFVLQRTLGRRAPGLTDDMWTRAQIWSSGWTFKEDKLKHHLQDRDPGRGRPLAAPYRSFSFLLRRSEEHVTETSGALGDLSRPSLCLYPLNTLHPCLHSLLQIGPFLIITCNYNFCGRQICFCLLSPTPPAQ